MTTTTSAAANPDVVRDILMDRVRALLRASSKQTNPLFNSYFPQGAPYLSISDHYIMRQFL